MTGRTPAFRPARTFHTVGPHGAGAVVDELLARLQAAPNVELVTAGTLIAVAARGDDTELRFSGLDAAVVARRPILGTGAEELFGAAGIAYAPDKVRTAIAWLDVSVDEIEGDLPHLVHVLDRDNPVLRVSRGGGDGTGPGSGRAQLTVELRHDSDEDALHATARDGLIAAGLLVKNAAPLPITGAARPTFAVPSAETRDAFRTARAAFDALQVDVELVGGGLDHAADSLNEQIVQGLRAASI